MTSNKDTEGLVVELSPRGRKSVVGRSQFAANLGPDWRAAKDARLICDRVRRNGEPGGGVNGDLERATIVRLGIYTLTRLDKRQILTLLDQMAERRARDKRLTADEIAEIVGQG